MLQELNLNVVFTNLILLNLQVLLEFFYGLLVLIDLLLQVLNVRFVLALLKFGQFFEVIDILKLRK